jgi:aldehyde dehydrogenase
MSQDRLPVSRGELESIVREILARLPSVPAHGGPADPAAHDGLYRDLDTALAGARRAFEELQELSLEQRKQICAAMRQAAKAEAETVSRMAVEETGLGRYEDKVQKNLLVAEKTPGPEILEPWAATGDHGLTLQELAPWGVLGAITPCTNPTETIVCNGIGIVAAGNSVVFCPHPQAKRVSTHMVAALNRAIVQAGGPASLLCCLTEPTIEQAQQLMRHPGVALLVVTGGPGVVREAMRSGKRVIAAGPGNPPSVVDETADIAKAARDLVLGASLDNNIICTDEKEAFVVSSVADALKSAMEAAGAQEIHGPQIEKMMSLIFAADGKVTDANDCAGRERPVRKEWIGQDAGKFLEAIGARPQRDVRLVIAEVEPDHPLVWTEQLLPVFPLVRVKTAQEAMELALAAEKGCRHSATMHSRNVERLSWMARRINTSIFVKNGPAFAGLGLGGEGYTSFTIAGTTGEGLTTARNFCRFRRCTLVDAFRIV